MAQEILHILCMSLTIRYLLAVRNFLDFNSHTEYKSYIIDPPKSFFLLFKIRQKKKSRFKCKFNLFLKMSILF